jgi:hypothetical protein
MELTKHIKSAINIFDTIFKKLKPQGLQNISRPKDIPPIVTDCGWNHGEEKIKTARN